MKKRESKRDRKKRDKIGSSAWHLTTVNKNQERRIAIEIQTHESQCGQISIDFCTTICQAPHCTFQNKISSNYIGLFKLKYSVCMTMKFCTLNLINWIIEFQTILSHLIWHNFFFAIFSQKHFKHLINLFSRKILFSLSFISIPSEISKIEFFTFI